MSASRMAKLRSCTAILKGLHVEPVAGQNALRVAPLRVGGGTAAACLGFVDDVVVDQGRGVNDLDHRAQLDGALAVVVQQLGGEQQQGRAQALAAAGAQIFADLGNGPHAGDRVAAELALDGGEVVVQQVKNFLGVADYGLQASLASSAVSADFARRKSFHHGGTENTEFSFHLNYSVISVPP
jgi:hypothetical protein